MTDSAFGLSTIGQILVPVSDVARATAFYRDALGVRFLFDFPHMAFFDADGVRLYLAEPEDPGFAGRATLYFRVPDIDAAVAALEARGVVFTARPHIVHRDGTNQLWMAFTTGPGRQQHRPHVGGPGRPFLTAGARTTLSGQSRAIGPRRCGARGTRAPARSRRGRGPARTPPRPRPSARDAAGSRPASSGGTGSRARAGSPASASTAASPAAGPATCATATARLSATTGDGATRMSTSYSPRICGQSVSAAAPASSWTAAIAAWSW